jgi:aminoglycoside/choline kinase family phosphotransferase
MDIRQNTLQEWLTLHFQGLSFQLEPLRGDASFRRYFRVHHGQMTFIAMDAPPDRENCRPFVAIAKALRQLGLNAPDILASDLQLGFLLMTDFGDRLYLNELTENNAEQLYGNALNALAVLQTCRGVSDWKVPNFTADFMRQELELFKEWFLIRYLNLNLTLATENKLGICFDFLAQTAAQQTQVFMHRDFHSANLMLLSDDQVGILDFQDAFMGPVTYDLVSLLRDCYIAWPDALVEKLALSYKQKINLHSVSETEFLRWFDLMGVQRHLKALLTFSRKYCRDQNDHYLQHIPRTLDYVLKVSSRYPECAALHEFLNKQVMTVCVE